ncbi:hypothetical protein AKJ16_DCAP14656 [Drosera capensis]
MWAQKELARDRVWGILIFSRGSELQLLSKPGLPVSLVRLHLALQSAEIQDGAGAMRVTANIPRLFKS